MSVNDQESVQSQAKADTVATVSKRQKTILDVIKEDNYALHAETLASPPPASHRLTNYFLAISGVFFVFMGVTGAATISLCENEAALYLTLNGFINFGLTIFRCFLRNVGIFVQTIWNMGMTIFGCVAILGSYEAWTASPDQHYIYCHPLPFLAAFFFLIFQLIFFMFPCGCCWILRCKIGKKNIESILTSSTASTEGSMIRSSRSSETFLGPLKRSPSESPTLRVSTNQETSALRLIEQDLASRPDGISEKSSSQLPPNNIDQIASSSNLGSSKMEFCPQTLSKKDINEKSTKQSNCPMQNLV